MNEEVIPLSPEEQEKKRLELELRMEEIAKAPREVDVSANEESVDRSV